MKKKNFSIIIQARVGSKRFPNKILKKYKNKSLLEIMLLRLLRVFDKSQIYIATTKKKEDTVIVNLCKKYQVKTYRGSEQNVLKRFIDTASKYKIKNIVRLTSDCPLIDSSVILRMLKIYFKRKLDYISNCYPYNKRSFPVGSDVEIIKFNVLNYLLKSCPNKYEKEHVTTRILKYYKKFKCHLYKLNKNFSNIRYTLDYHKDYEVINKILNYLEKKKLEGSYNQIVNFLVKNKKIFNINSSFSKIYYKSKIRYY